MHTANQLKNIITSNSTTVPEKRKAIEDCLVLLKDKDCSSDEKGNISRFLRSFVRDGFEISGKTRILVAKQYFPLALENFSDVKEEVFKCARLGDKPLNVEALQVTYEALRVTAQLATIEEEARRIILRYSRSGISDYPKPLVIFALRATTDLAIQRDDEALRIILRYSDLDSGYYPADDDIRSLSIELLGRLAGQGIPRSVSRLKRLHSQFQDGELMYLDQSVRLAIVASHRVLLQA